VYVGAVSLGLPMITHCNVFALLLNEKHALQGLEKNYSDISNKCNIYKKTFL
jgi:hypothetical protein